MSRYGFNVGNVEIVVGWDNPTQTFFGTTEAAGEVVVDTMIGMGQFNVQDIRVLECMIGFNIPDDIRKTLLDDRASAPSPTPLQTRMGEIFKPLLEGEK